MLQKITQLIKNVGPVIGAILAANFLNFAFNALLARKLSLSEYGFVSLLNTFWSMLLVGAAAILQITSYQVASAGKDSKAALLRYVAIHKMTRWIAGILAVSWVLTSSWLMHFFKAPHLIGVLVFGPMIFLGLLTGVNRGYIQGRLNFNQIGFLYLIESVTKFLLAIAALSFGMPNLAYWALPLSVGFTWVISDLAVKRILPRLKRSSFRDIIFPWSLLWTNLLAGLAAMSFLSLDLVLAKHYLSTSAAGSYAILSLSGKMVYFLGSILNGFMQSLLGKAESLGSDVRKVYRKFYALALGLVVSGFVLFGLLGSLTAAILFGQDSKTILPYLISYSAGTALFTLASVTVTYHIIKKRYIFPILSLISAGLMVGLIALNHASVQAIANSVWQAGLFGFVIITGADLFLAKRATNKLAKPQPPVNLIGKRILVLNWRDTQHAQAGGAEVYIHELASRWVLAGNEVTMFAGNDGESPREEIIDGIKILRRGSFYMAYFWAFIYYQTRFRGKFDLIIDCHNGIPFFTPLYAREPIYCVLHHVHQDVFTRFLNKPMATVARFLEKTAMPWAYRNSQYLTVSKSSKEAMVEELGIPADKIRIVHNGVDLQSFVPGNKSKDPTILYLGRLKEYKSVDVLLRAFAIVHKRSPNARLVIAGAGDDEQRLKTIVKELRIASTVSFEGRVSETQKLELLQESWVVVNPSYMEGWGITNIEANACGTPVVASDVPGLRDSVEALYSGYLVEYGSPEAFAEKIELIIKDKKHRLQLSSNANEWAQNFDWQISATTFMEYIS